MHRTSLTFCSRWAPYRSYQVLTDAATIFVDTVHEFTELRTFSKIYWRNSHMILELPKTVMIYSINYCSILIFIRKTSDRNLVIKNCRFQYRLVVVPHQVEQGQSSDIYAPDMQPDTRLHSQ